MAMHVLFEAAFEENGTSKANAWPEEHGLPSILS